jgi:serine phosphatase RsbU (regulator of sigma subunit)/PAS domain-containing protein
VVDAGLSALGLLVCGLVAAALGLFVWSRRQGGAGTALAAVLAAVSIWNLAYAAELLASTPGWRLALGSLKYVGICGLVPGWLAFILFWTGHGALVTRRLMLLLLVEPAVLLLLLAVPDTRDLVRYLPADAADPMTVEVATGPVFWVNLVYNDLLLLPATAAFVASLVRRSRVYWLQAAALTAAALLPWVANLLFTLSVGSLGALDLTPAMFTLTGAVLTWGLFQQRLLRLTPLARSTLVDRMTDAVLVLDLHGRVSDANPAATALLGGGEVRLLGAPGELVLPEVLATGPATGERVVLRRGGGPRTYDVTDIALPGERGQPSGRLLVLRDVTERAHLEQQLRELLADQARVAEQLSSSLRPPRLPVVPGAQLAARFRPAGAGREIGGDFYDVFAVGDEWAFALGDVSGKGAKAAATTAHARYSLRTLVLAGAQPAAALEQLHAVVVDGLDDETYLTVVHGRVRTAADGLHVALALGGHPQPLLLRADGRVESAGLPGSAIGLFDTVEVCPCEVHLAPGDALVLFTDGVSEARGTGSGAMFGDQALAATLSRAAGGTAEQVAQAVLGGVLGLPGGEPADDIAVLVVRAAVRVATAPPQRFAMALPGPAAATCAATPLLQPGR